MGATVYILCMLTSFACSVLLFRGYRQNRFRLLFWSGWCFLGFALNNLLLFVDLVLTQSTTDLSVVRTLPALAGIITMVYGLISDAVQE